MKAQRIHDLSLVIACAAATTAGAQVGLGFGGGISFESQHEIVPGTNEYRIDGDFAFDPDQGGWMKELIAPPGGWIPDMVYAVHETITFFPDPTGGAGFPLSDWHEHIELGSDGLIWDIWELDPMFMVNGMPAPGLMTMFNDERTDIWFLFDPIDIGPNGVTLEIWKEFRYVGSMPMDGPVRIYEYPTPTPGAAAVLGIAGLFSARRRR